MDQPIDGIWRLEGLLQYDVEGTVKCRWSGSLDIQQLPGGVNTVVGSGSYTVDCLVPGPPFAPQVTANLQNSRLVGTQLGMTWGGCGMGAEYDRRRPAVLSSSRAFCRMAVPGLPTLDVAGTWRAEREMTP